MGEVLVIVERDRTGVEETTWELATAARGLSDGGSVTGLVIGAGAGDLADALTPWFDEVLVADDGSGAGDGVAHGALIAAVIGERRPALTLLAHSNVGIDIAPRAGALADVPVVTDAIQLEADDGSFRAVRAVYGGKANARVRIQPSQGGALVTLRPGAFPAGEAPGVSGSVSEFSPPAPDEVRRRHIETVAPEAGAVDLTGADVLVAVGRGIEEEDNLEIVRDLAEALGAELACTRPVVDKGWLPKAHQVGTSGVSVRPKVYVAAGVSGSFQHMGGVKGDPYIIAINEDESAPIFSVADVGIVGDLFDILPLLEEKIREAKG